MPALTLRIREKGEDIAIIRTWLRAVDITVRTIRKFNARHFAIEDLIS